jgi:hypothetical protein
MIPAEFLQLIITEEAMKIAKPLLIVATPVGLLSGFYECYELAGGLLFLMLAMVGVCGVALASVITVIRREERESRAAPAASTDAKEIACNS